MTLSDAIEKMRKHRLLIGITDGEKSDRATALDMLLSIASENKEDWKRWVVQFTDGSFCFEREIPRKRKYKYEQNLLGIDNIELYGLTVTGNVYDNPELLEVKR